eukprot:1485534-Pyramimonas_sp.AAC.1
MGKIGSAIRWMPHPLMPVDCMTKSDLAKTNAAHLMLLKSGMLRLTAEDALHSGKEGGPPDQGAFQGRVEATAPVGPSLG